MSYSLYLSPEELKRYVEMRDAATKAEGEAWARLGARPGARIADVGCGPGVILCALAKMVGPRKLITKSGEEMETGVVHAVERNPRAVKIAKAWAAHEHVENARFFAQEASTTGLEEGSYDLVMIRHVLVHNDANMAQDIINHVATLLKPGGHLYLVESDLSAIRRVPDNEDLWDMEQCWLEMLRMRGCDVAIGTQLRQYLRDAGLEVRPQECEARYDTYVRRGTRPPEWAAHQLMRKWTTGKKKLNGGPVTEARLDRWRRALREKDRLEEPLVYVPMFRAVGRRRDVPQPSSKPRGSSRTRKK